MRRCRQRRKASRSSRYAGWSVPTCSRQRDDWKVIDNPFADGDDPIVLLPAIRPDFALFHAPLADRHGNVYIGRQRDLLTMAHAAQHTLVTVEALTDDDLMRGSKRGARRDTGDLRNRDRPRARRRVAA